MEIATTLPLLHISLLIGRLGRRESQGSWYFPSPHWYGTNSGHSVNRFSKKEVLCLWDHGDLILEEEQD